MTTDTRKKIYAYIQHHQPVRVADLHDEFGISKEMIHRHLRVLVQDKQLYKEGSPPRVQYYARGGIQLSTEDNNGSYVFTLRNNGKVLTRVEKHCTAEVMYDEVFLKNVRRRVEEIVEQNYLVIGKTVKPNHLFSTFAKVYIQNDKKLLEKFSQYVQENFSDEVVDAYTDRFYAVFFTLMQYTTKQGRLDASIKLRSLLPLYQTCKETIAIDALYYTGVDKIDAYKTYNYEVMERIKEFQDEQEIRLYYENIFSKRFKAFLEHHAIDTILVVPNNVKRQISFNEYIATRLKQDYPALSQIGVITNMFSGRKPQKKVSGVCKRIENATKLFDIDEQTVQGGEQIVLIIDDVFGSGATMNTVCKKLKSISPEVKCIGFALLGSYRKGFDVVTGI